MKKRSLNEYRQVKDSVYTHIYEDELKTNKILSYILKKYCDKYPNDKDLGQQIRKLINDGTERK